MPRLENWSLMNGALVGVVFDDPRFSDGDIIHTTPLKSMDIDKRTAQTQNTTYELGKPFGDDEDLNKKDGSVMLQQGQ